MDRCNPSSLPRPHRMRPIGQRTRRFARAVRRSRSGRRRKRLDQSVAARSCAAFGEPEASSQRMTSPLSAPSLSLAPGPPGRLGEAVPTHLRSIVHGAHRCGPLGSSWRERCELWLHLWHGRAWLVSADRQDADLETSLCSGNSWLARFWPTSLRRSGTAPESRTGARRAGVRESPSDIVPLAAGLAVVATVALAAVSILAFRTGRRRPA